MENPPIFNIIPKITSNEWKNDTQRYMTFGNNYYNINFTQIFRGINDESLNNFIADKKRLYKNNIEVKEQICDHFNYFERYFDKEKELLTIYLNMKIMIDNFYEYSIESLKHDIDRYIVIGLQNKIEAMNNLNFMIDLIKKSRNKKVVINEKLHYTNDHGRSMMKCSLIIKFIIPLIVHYMYIKNTPRNEVDTLLMEVFEVVVSRVNNQDGINIINKLVESAKQITNISVNRNIDNWKTQSIIGYNPSKHIEYSTKNLIVNVFCKYNYSKNIIHFNSRALKDCSSWKVNKVSFDYMFVPTTSHKSEDGKTTEADMYESKLIKEDESLYIQIIANGQRVIKFIESKFGKVTEEEINYYLDNIGSINSFQKQIISYLFYKYFGDTESVKTLRNLDIIKLMICGKRMLLHHGLVVIPYIMSGKIITYAHRKSISKKETERVSNSIYFKKIQETYKSEKIEKIIMSIFATLLTTDFTIIDFDNKDLTGTKLPNIYLARDKISEEIITCINLITMR